MDFKYIRMKGINMIHLGDNREREHVRALVNLTLSLSFLRPLMFVCLLGRLIRASFASNH